MPSPWTQGPGPPGPISNFSQKAYPSASGVGQCSVPPSSLVGKALGLRPEPQACLVIAGTESVSIQLGHFQNLWISYAAERTDFQEFLRSCYAKSCEWFPVGIVAGMSAPHAIMC